MNYICCDHCATEFVVKDTISTSLRCPDCNQWIDAIEEPKYVTASYGSSYAYDNYDMDNYGYDD